MPTALPDRRRGDDRRDVPRFIGALLAVALGAAAFAIAFRLALSFFYREVYGADTIVDAMTALPLWLRVAAPLAGATVAGLVSRYRIRRSQNASNVMEAVALGNVHLSLATTAWRIVGSWSAIATGLSIGREGPLIEFGGTLGAAAGRLARLPVARARVLVAAGTAAGFAAAYNTPFAAVLFVVEALVGIAALEALLPTMTATVIATALTRALVGGGPIYGARTFAMGDPLELTAYVALGVAAAGVASLFKHTLALFETAADRFPLPQPWRAATGGLLVGLVLLAVPHVAGNGYEPLNDILDQRAALSFVAVLLVAKIVATSASVASGAPGGMFTPALLVGGALGSLYGTALHGLGLVSATNPGSYALVGMAACIAATLHAPLTASVMVFELSGDYAVVLPLLLSTVVATAVSRGFRSLSIYESELRERGIGWTLTIDGRVVAPQTVDPGTERS